MPAPEVLGDEHLAFVTTDPHEAHDRARRLMAAHRMRAASRHPSRFVAAYRRRFGEPPSATLRR